MIGVKQACPTSNYIERHCYSGACLDYPHLNMTKVEKNRVIRVDIINLDNEKTSICQQHVLVKDGQRLAMLHQSSISFLNRIFMTG